MSKTIDHLYRLYNNPFFLTPILIEFYKAYQGKQSKDILLSYIVLPIVLYEDSKLILLRKNKDRTIRTFINYHKKEDKTKFQKEIKKNEKLFGLPERVEEFKEMTNLCLQYAFDRGCLKLNEEDLSISYIKNDFEKDNTLVEFLTVAENLSIMFKKEKITHIYMKLGIKKL